MHILSRVDPRWSTAVVALLMVVGFALQPDPALPPASAAARSAPEPVSMLLTTAPTGTPVIASRVVSPAATPDTRIRTTRVARAGRAARHVPPTLEQRGEAALRALPYDWRRLGYTVRFRPYDGTALGTANRRTRTITVYIRPQQSELSLRASIAHELGHALDFTHGTPERRDAYRRVRGLSTSSAWFPCNRCNDFSSPAGDFAEVFAAWLVGPGDFRSRLAGPPTRRQLTELAPQFEVPPTRTGRAAPPPPAAPEEEEEEESGLPTLLPPPPRPAAE